jgi:hypothetical protein
VNNPKEGAGKNVFLEMGAISLGVEGSGDFRPGNLFQNETERRRFELRRDRRGKRHWEVWFGQDLTTRGLSPRLP